MNSITEFCSAAEVESPSATSALSPKNDHHAAKLKTAVADKTLFVAQVALRILPSMAEALRRQEHRERGGCVDCYALRAAFWSLLLQHSTNRVAGAEQATGCGLTL
jgi:hypothetical protein